MGKASAQSAAQLPGLDEAGADIDLMHLWERKQQMTKRPSLLIIFLQKPGGSGVITIALTSFFAWFWARLRLAVAQGWEQESSDRVFAGTALEECEATGWAHNVLAAWAKA